METDVVTNMPSTPTSYTPTSYTNTSTSDSGSKMWKYIIIFLILAFLGFNLLTYVGKFSKFAGHVVDKLLDAFRPILAYFGYGIGEVAKTTIDLTAKGSTKAIDLTADTLTGGIDVLQSGLKKGGRRLDRDIGQAKQGQGQGKGKRQGQRQMQYPLPDDAGSTTQASKGTRKAGFCYIGEDRGFRSCISVGEGDECMSGDIFPTRDMCINPNLR